MASENFVRKTIYLTPAQDEFIRTSSEPGVTHSSLIRNLINDAIQRARYEKLNRGC